MARHHPFAPIQKEGAGDAATGYGFYRRYNPRFGAGKRERGLALFSSLVAFALAAALLTVTPGLDTALVLRTLASEGPRPAFRAACGIGAGCLAWGAIVAAGLGALLAASALAYDLLRWAGAAYLLTLGVRLWRSPRRTAFADTGYDREAGRNWFVRGFLTNILNPKVGIFYVSFLPQFIPYGAAVSLWTLALAAVHVALGLLWFGLLIGASRPMLRLLRRPRVVTALDRATGVLFVGFGLRLALAARR